MANTNSDNAAAEALAQQASFYRNETPIVPARTDFSVSPAEYYSQFSLEELSSDLNGSTVETPETTEEFQRWARQKKAQSRVSFKEEGEERTPTFKDTTINTEKKTKSKAKKAEAEEPVKHKAGWLMLNIGFWAMVAGTTSMLMPSFSFLMLAVAMFCGLKVLISKNYGTFWTHVLGVLLVFAVLISMTMTTVLNMLAYVLN